MVVHPHDVSLDPLVCARSVIHVRLPLEAVKTPTLRPNPSMADAHWGAFDFDVYVAHKPWFDALGCIGMVSLQTSTVLAC